MTVGLLFPFGSIPSYMDNIDFSRSEEYLEDSRSGYGVCVDGTAIDATLRHSYWGSEKFDLAALAPRLTDGWAEDPFYNPEMIITKYTYQVLAGDSWTGECVLEDKDRVRVHCVTDMEKTRVYMNHLCEAVGTPEGVRLGTYYHWGQHNEEGRLFSLYVIGEPLQEEPVWSVYSKNDVSQEIDIPIELVSTEQIPLKELFCRYWNPEGEVSQSDWYNAVLYRVNSEYAGRGFIGWNDGLDVRGSLMRWYEYELTFEPGQQLVNSVTAPLDPSIDENWDPSKYEYTYLLSPAKTWTSFGSLNITINTPSYLMESDPAGFEKTAEGYSLKLDGLPEGELTFTLCASEYPESTIPTVEDYYPKLIGPVLMFFLVNGALVVGFVLFLRWARGK